MVRLLLITSILLQVALARPVLVPRPKDAKFDGTSVPVESPAIVISEAASEQEVYAAETLQSSVKRRFGTNWEIGKNGRTTVVFEVDPSLPHDGYSIKMTEGKVIISGRNSRALIYGQDTVFQLLHKEDGKLMLPQASIKDWPSIPWRGKPQTSLESHLQPGFMDWYVRARLNFIDLRNGVYAFEPDDKLDEELVGKVIREAHRRGIVVYATVNCGTGRDKYDAIISKFERFIQLGADGLWASFDDRGPGEAPKEIVARVIELGKKHKITGQMIAICPPKGSYQMIVSDFTKSMLAVPGMDEALWFFTCVPTPENLEAAKSLGMKIAPAWWHNWPRAPGRSMLDQSVLPVSFHYGSISRKDGKPPYLPVPSLAEGWHSPTYELLATCGATCSAVMQWGGSAWKGEYTYPVMGWWAWNPEGHDWQAVRGRIYELVYGPAHVQDAMALDDAFDKLRRLFLYPVAQEGEQVKFPPRLADEASRPQAVKLVAELEASLKRLQTTMAEESFVSEERFEPWFLDSARAELVTARAAAELDYPEYSWDEHQRKVLHAIYDGDLAGADKLIQDAEPRLIAQASEARDKLTEVAVMDKYAQHWADKANLDAKGWQSMVGNRKTEFPKMVEELVYQRVGKLPAMPKNSDPPEGASVISKVLPEREFYAGEWHSGRHGDAFIIMRPNKVYTNIGDYIEAEISTPARPFGVRFYVDAWVGESLGLQTIRGRWLGRRFISLLDGDKVLWREDVSNLPGGKWVTVSLPEQDTGLRLRVDDLQVADNYPALIRISPILIFSTTR